MHSAAPRAPDVEPAQGRWARDTLASLAAVPGVRRVGLALTDGGGRELLFTASDRDEAADGQWCLIDAYDEVPLNAAIRSGAPVVGSLQDLRGRFGTFVERQRDGLTAALAAVPVVGSGQVLGGYVLFFDSEQRFGPGRVRALAAVGCEVGAALRRLQREDVRPAPALTDEPVPPGARAVVHELAPEPAAVPQARRFLRSTLASWGVDGRAGEAAELCLSELVTNVVMHTGSGCGVRVLLDRGVLTTTVRDCGASRPTPVSRPVDPLGVHGRGLQIVEALADRWGSELDGVGTTVWFEIEL